MANSWIQEEMRDKRRVDTLWEHENMNNSNGCQKAWINGDGVG